MNVRSGRESALAMTAEHINCCTGEKVPIGDKIDLTGTLALVAYGAV